MSLAADRTARPTTPWAILAAEILVGGVLLTHALGEKSFWLDEALSVQRAGSSWAALWREITTTQANMGLYYVALHPWLAFGTSEAVVRSSSVVFAIAALPLVYLLAARVADPRAGLAAVLLLVLNSFFVQYGQEARGYSLAVLLVTWASYQFVRSIERPSVRAWVLYAVAGTLALYAHLFAGLVLLAHAVSILFLPRPRVPWRHLALGWGLVAVLTAPLAAFVLFRDVGQIDWVPSPRAIDILYVLRALSGEGGWMLLGLYALACAMAIGPSSPASTDDAPWQPWRRWFLAAWLVTPPAVALLVSLVKPVLQPRYLIVALPPFVILAAVGLARVRVRAVAVACAVALLWLSASGVRQWYDAPDRQYWRRAAEFVMSRARPGDAVTFYVYSARVPFEYYVHRLHVERSGVDLVDLTSDPWVAGNRQPEPSAAILADLVAHHRRVWLVRLQDGAPPGHPLRRFEQSRIIETALTQRFAASATEAFPGGIRIQLYEPRNGAD